MKVDHLKDIMLFSLFLFWVEYFWNQVDIVFFEDLCKKFLIQYSSYSDTLLSYRCLRIFLAPKSFKIVRSWYGRKRVFIPPNFFRYEPSSNRRIS